MIANGRPGSAPPPGTGCGTGPGPHGAAARDGTSPKSLGAALRVAGMDLDRPRRGSETASEEDYDKNVRPAITSADGGVRRRREPPAPFLELEDKGIIFRDSSGVHIFSDDDHAIQDFLKRSSQRAKEADPTRRPGKFSDLVFTRQFSAFDRHNLVAVNSPFHGFYTLFWLAVALFVFKISADNWRTYGTPLGSSDIMKTMFHREGERSTLKTQLYG